MLIIPVFATVCGKSFSSSQNIRVSFYKYFEGVRLFELWYKLPRELVVSPSLEILKTLWNRQPVVADTDLKMTLILVQAAAQQSQEVPSNF